MSALLVITAIAAQAAASSASPQPGDTKAPHPLTGSHSYVDLEGGAGYSSNSSMQLGDNTGSGFGRISVHGVHTGVSDRTTTLLSAFAQSTFYTQNYGAQPSLNLSASHSAQVNERLNIFGDLSFTYDEGGQLDTRILSLPDVPFPPGSQPPVSNPTGDFVSVTGKSFGASALLGAQMALSERDSLSGSAGLTHSTFKNGGVETHYNTVPISLGYNRQLNEQTSVGATVSAEFTDYSGPTSTTIVTPQLTASTRLSQSITASAAVGVSFAKVDNGFFTRHSTGFAGHASVCSTGERSRFCGSVRVDQEAATVAGPARTISGAVDYSLTLDANQSLAFALGVSHYSTPNAIFPIQSSSDALYFHAAADYSRRIGSRWFAGASLSARKDDLRGRADPKADVSGSLFVRYRLGDIQ